MGLVDRVNETRLATRPGGSSERFNLDQYISDYLVPAGQFNYNGQNYPLGLNQTVNGWTKSREVAQSLPAYASALMRCPPAYAAQMIRAMVLSQARMVFRTRIFNSTPRKLFGTSALGVLDRPWPNATLGDLISRMEWHEGCAGNSFVTNWEPNRLRVLRPDWVAIVYGSELEPQDPGFALDGEIVGYVYQNGGFTQGNRNPVRTLRVSEVAHWCPNPNPISPSLGMSWITPALRDMQGDGAATEHKLRFFENGATPNLVIKGLPAVTEEKFNALVDMLEANHSGVRNAYRTYYLTAGADATVVGSDMQQMAFAETQGKGETRIAMLARVPAVVLQISEGLSGSSLNAGNFLAARRTMADTWVYPTLQNLAGSLAPLVAVPPDAELWPDTTDMPFLREDAKDAADIQLVNAQAIGGLVKDGFTPESAVAAVIGQNMNLLKPIPGWISVQLQTMQQAKTSPPPANGSSPPPQANGSEAQANGKATSRAQEMVADELRFQNRELSETLRAMMDRPQAPAPTINAYITIPERSVTVENSVQPANATVEIQGDTINVEPAAVSIPVTVQPAPPAAVNVAGDTINVQPAEISVPVNVTTPDVKVEAPVTVNLPPDQPTKPSKGVTVERDKDGNVTGVTPK